MAGVVGGVAMAKRFTMFNTFASVTCGDFFHFEGVVEEGSGRKVVFDEFLENDDSHIRVIDAFHAVPDAHDQLTLLPHVVDKVVGLHVAVET